MAHDKESIKNLKKVDGFDKEIDPLILDIDDEERKKLLSSFESANFSQDSDDELEGDLPGLKRGKKRKKKKKVSFFQKVLNFLRNLFSDYKFSEDANISAKEVKKIKTSLTTFKVPILDFKTRKIKSTFATFFYKIKVIIDDLNTLLEEAQMENSEINLSDPIFFIRFISNLLSEETKGKLQLFTNEYIARLIDNEKNPMVLLKTELQDFESKVRMQEKGQIKVYIEILEKLMTFHSYNFSNLFSFFKSEVESENKGTMPLFKDVDSDIIIDELKKLNDYCRVINIEKLPNSFSEEFDNTLQSLRTTDVVLDEEDDDSDNTEENAENNATFISDNKYDNLKISAKKLDKCIKDINVLNENNILDYLIQYLTQDHDYKGKMVKTNVYLLEKYIELLKEKAIANFNRLEIYKREEKLTSNICKFFKVRRLKELSKIPNYN